MSQTDRKSATAAEDLSNVGYRADRSERFVDNNKNFGRCQLSSPALHKIGWKARIAAQACEGGFGHRFSFARVACEKRNNSGFCNGIVVASSKQSVADKDHLFQRITKKIAELADAAGLINAWLGDINGCRATDKSRKLSNECVKDGFDPPPLGANHRRISRPL